MIITPESYIAALPEDRKAPVSRLRQEVLQHLPAGFAETIGYGMLAYVVPHTLYPAGYKCDPKLPLPFMNIASQKGHIAVYHMALYASSSLMDWFLEEWKQVSAKKPDMGKSCIRFKKPENIPFELIGALAGKVTPQEWIAIYETAFTK
ncbi:DUF1801 domain-containing protein [Chitinophaga nivalis]|uniref:DUF1801 domain-containing protein n=1 Tax=Chitinophaga nivalis TaxID=2991709 RepID=A0ABT3IGN6_9BACT|nr:DUF1801 domain-containing protein [Chitinophaga nivalis]MCW3467202.1 DUF1801 domain-containing protein [Chitinophaga nivalis]MCW3483106.1 DUF1801 domain-containing protein [Chitinophaga nivalis]